MRLLISPVIKKALIHITITFSFCMLSIIQTHSQEPEETNLSGLPYIIKEVTANNVTFSCGVKHGFTTGEYVEIVDQDTRQRVTQAQIAKVTPEKITAIISDLRFSSVDVGDLIRLSAKVTVANPNWVEIDHGTRQGLVEGTTFKVFRMGKTSEMELEEKGDLPQRTMISRAVLIDVRQENATARIIGKRVVQPIEGDFVQIEAYTTIGQKFGNIVYLDVASDLMTRLSEGMIVFVFQKNVVLHPGGSQRHIEWYQTVCSLTIQHVARGSHTARCTINDEMEYEPSSNDHVSIEDMHARRRLTAVRNVYVLKSDINKIYLNRFPEAERDLVFIAARKKTGTNQIDPNFLNANLQNCSFRIESIQDQVIAAIFLSQSKNPFQVGDCIRIFH